MICPICKTNYTTTPFDDLEKVSPIAPTPIRIYGNPVVSILLFHYFFAFLGAISVKVNLPVGDIYMGSILCYQIAFFAMLHKYTQPQDFWTYLKVYCSRKNWGLPVIQIAILCFLGYNPSAFFVAGVCANGLLSFYWPLHVETIHECNRLAIEDMAVRLTLMED